MATKVLYVEDEPFLGRIVKESLESRDFAVTMVADGGFALKVFEQLQPDICVLDIMLPQKDGYAIARDIRKLNPTVPIIFVSAKNQTEDVLAGFGSGGNDYLRKPFSMEELIVRIHNLLSLSGARASAQAQTARFGAFEFDPNRYELRQGEHVRKLSHKEATLLGVLLSRRNETVTRKEILMKVWGDDSFFNSRNLDVYLTKLRDYLQGDPAVEIITIKGVGYRFSVTAPA
jgi:DNA-binding response OmpR family regulator